MAHESEKAKLRFLFYFSIFMLAFFGGTVGFVVLENMSWGNSVYFVMVTMSTVGYGDISAETAAGRLLVVVVIVVGVAAFVSMMANAAEVLLSRRERESRMHKLNMVIGLFFSEVGTDLLTVLSDADPRREEIKDILRVEGDWTARDFARVQRQLQEQERELQPEAVMLPELKHLLSGQRPFVVGLLENPAVMDYEAFTDLLWAVFHLIDELEAREDVSSLISFDRGHILGDAQRAYELLVLQWLRYMEHMQQHYPYLFSRAVRTNPFVVKKSKILEQKDSEDA